MRDVKDVRDVGRGGRGGPRRSAGNFAKFGTTLPWLCTRPPVAVHK